ncbi:hypothetical protein AVEN_270579-1 [Araneus ventricosus]|uniref:Uncharacterized protein n=1 Tax=Araneus ventricosus TaxID=182803 RepID=A0A4Y2B4S4_ARAVE|nr:hypothetical protein AVEN_270579-1 [Araneus ventricosus]
MKDGARHLWHFISSSQYLAKKYRDIIEPVISRNAYFAAPENMLLAMLTDDLAARRIMKAREIGQMNDAIKKDEVIMIHVHQEQNGKDTGQIGDSVKLYDRSLVMARKIL